MDPAEEDDDDDDDAEGAQRAAEVSMLLRLFARDAFGNNRMAYDIIVRHTRTCVSAYGIRYIRMAYAAVLYRMLYDYHRRPLPVLVGLRRRSMGGQPEQLFGVRFGR